MPEERHLSYFEKVNLGACRMPLSGAWVPGMRMGLRPMLQTFPDFCARVLLAEKKCVGCAECWHCRRAEAAMSSQEASPGCCPRSGGRSTGRLWGVLPRATRLFRRELLPRWPSTDWAAAFRRVAGRAVSRKKWRCQAQHLRSRVMAAGLVPGTSAGWHDRIVGKACGSWEINAHTRVDNRATE